MNEASMLNKIEGKKEKNLLDNMRKKEIKQRDYPIIYAVAAHVFTGYAKCIIDETNQKTLLSNKELICS